MESLVARTILKSACIAVLCLQGAYLHAQCCNYTLSLRDSYGDGWQGATLEVLVNNLSVGVFKAHNFGSTETFVVCPGDSLQLVYTPGDYENENSYQLLDASWNVLFKDGPYPQTGMVFSAHGDCEDAVVPGSYPCTAIPIDTGDCVVADNTGFQSSGLSPNCANYQGKDMWFTMKVPESGNLSFKTDSGSINDTGIAVWTGNSCTDLQVVGCDDDGGRGYFSFLLLDNLTPGQTIYIQLFGWSGATGSYRLCVRDLGHIVLDSSELPIVMINTLGKSIVPDTKVDCRMDIKFRGPGAVTYVSDSSNVYSGNIGIEVRGATSSGYPQKPFNIETRNSDGSNNNVSLLGMPAENDWVLLSHYNDHTLLRNALAFNLFGEMGNYSVRAQLCEVLIDSAYRGIYLFGEKIRRDSSRVNIAKLTPADTLGDQLTGGYILQQNYWNPDNSFQSNYSPIGHPGFDVHFVYEYPDPSDIHPAQKAYIAAFVDSLETALYSPDFADPTNGYRKFLDVKSFIDYFLVNEVSRNPDGFKKSVFFNKDKFSNGGKLKAGPVWDFDWAFKNQDFCVYSSTEGAGWAHYVNDCSPDNYSTGWYIRLLQDSTFNNELRCTYEDYRHNILDTATIFAYIDSMGNLVQNAQKRHFQKWPLLGMSGQDAQIEPVAKTYYAGLDTLKTWIAKRLHWLDLNIPGLCAVSGVQETHSMGVFQCYPNPASDNFTVDYSLPDRLPVTVRVMNCLGEMVVTEDQGMQNAGRHSLKFETASLPPGVYLVVLESGTDTAVKKVVVAK